MPVSPALQNRRTSDGTISIAIGASIRQRRAVFDSRPLKKSRVGGGVVARGRSAKRVPLADNPGGDSTVFQADALEMGLYFAALVAGALALLSDVNSQMVANTAVPIVLALAIAWGCLRMALSNIECILTPTFVMRIAMMFYGPIGSLIAIYSDEETQALILTFFEFSESELLKYNVVLAVFCAAFCLSPLLYRIFIDNAFRRPIKVGLFFSIEPSNVSIQYTALAFIAIAAVAKYIFILPFTFGLVTGEYPLFLGQLALLDNIGIFLSLVWALRYRPYLAPLIVAYGIFAMLVAILTFSKTEVILPAIMMSAAYVYVRPNIFKMGVALAFILITFNAIQPIIMHGREWVGRCCAGIDAPVGFEERIGIISNYFIGEALTIDNNVNYAVVRFSYANVGSYVVSARDNGWPGDSLKYAVTVFIPRVIWPEKPVITDIARDLNIAVTGNPNSSVSPGFAAEGYWDGGWLGVVCFALFIGFICHLWSLYAVEVQRAGAWHLFIIVLLGVRLGTRFDGFLVVDFLGPIGYAIIGHIIIVFLNRTLAPGR